MQIKELIIYGYNDKTNNVKFNLGQLNMITGESKTGKSAIADIIEYCLGSSGCNIATGIIRDNVEWYGLILKFDKDEVFVARKNPKRSSYNSETKTINKAKKTSTVGYIEFGNTVVATKSLKTVATISYDNIVNIL